MRTHRQFVIAPSLARLIQKGRGGERVLEGYFPGQPQRSTYVQIGETCSSLILEAGGNGPTEEQADLPLAHAQALLAVSQGQVEYVRTRLSIGAREIQVVHFVRPSPLDLVMMTVAPEDEQDFHPLSWFGPEVSAEPAYERRRLALGVAPEAPEVEFTNAALNSLLDLLENRFTTWPLPGQAVGSDQPAPNASPLSKAPVPKPETERDQEIGDRGIEDTVIRDLARALQPRQR
ncbi:hypothetical protein DC522_27135 [Microvirga sp. KLBC 81]|uniref:hypothetical protein n=1 Tax=Microvirga sp. KLBC 81 TaxID=1862707 RepID=UPI000D5180C4|nr:hypothetical protein [Microvirga sp. KLBC 81]PVE21352.1 hypothetical protein DC522_27135 [Microvirga sp. KLBC 81]